MFTLKPAYISRSIRSVQIPDKSIYHEVTRARRIVVDRVNICILCVPMGCEFDLPRSDVYCWCDRHPDVRIGLGGIHAEINAYIWAID